MTTEEETMVYMSSVAERMLDRFFDRIRVKFPALDYTKTMFPYIEIIPGDDETKGKSAIHYTLDKPIGEVSFEKCTDRPRNHSIYGITVQCAYGCFARARFFPKPLPVSGTEPGTVLPWSVSRRSGGSWISSISWRARSGTMNFGILPASRSSGAGRELS